ncbi:MAG: response regulator transcription factor [Flavobacteriales bacterium]|nr:response regulator transcription factor [Flavobacteriales bacterium]
MEKIRIAVADDQEYLRNSIAHTLELFDELECIYTASNGNDLIEKLKKGPIPHLILMDINMPEMNGVEATAIISELFPEVKVLMLTVFEDEHHIFDSIMAGASGYLLKDEKPMALYEAIHEAMEGGAPMSTSIARKALQLIRTGKPIDNSISDQYQLSKREIEILENIAQGLNYQEIAEKLFISPKTVRKHIENIYEKLRVHNKIEAVNLARKYRIISLLV